MRKPYPEVMSRPAPLHRPSAPPARRLRLLANLAPAAAVLFGLVTVWLAVSTVQNLAQPISIAVVLSLVLGTAGVLVAGLTTYRLGVQVPRTLRGWERALHERAQAVRRS